LTTTAAIALVVLTAGMPFATYYQNVDLNVIKDKHPQYLVVDPYSGPNDVPWTQQEVQTVKSYGVHPLAYLPVMVVGYHETDLYDYAKQNGLLGPEDPVWKCDAAVEFWDQGYVQELEQVISRFHDMGFEGIMFDAVDAWSYRWYLDWYENTFGGTLDDLKQKAYQVLQELAGYAQKLGMIVAVNCGAAASDPTFQDLVKKYGWWVVAENVIADGSGNLLPDDSFEANLNALKNLGDRIYVIEYNIDPNDQEVKERLEEVFSVEGVKEVYITDPAHDEIGEAVVPSSASAETQVPGSNGIPLLPLVLVPRRVRRC